VDAADTAATYRQCLAQVDADAFTAVTDAERWLRQGGGDPARHCLAAGMLALGQTRAAALELQTLADRPGLPAHREAALLAQTGDAWLRTGEPDRAAAALGRALALDPGNASLRIDRARAEAEAGRLKGAVDDLGLVIDSDPLRVEAYVLRASALRRLGAFDRAAADIATAMTLDPRSPEILLERGLLRLAAGDRSGGEADLRQLVATAPGSAAAQVARGHLAAAGGG
jgi:tetratricopeptide (TPR) repeat protein